MIKEKRIWKMNKNEIEIFGKVALAPMAGVTDLPFRLICKAQGADLLYTEMINAKALCYEDKNTYAMLDVEEEEKPVIVQIFGSEPEYMAKAAEILSGLGRFYAIDVNMGCPVPKVVRFGDGCALMKNPSQAAQIIYRMKEVSHLPVTVKFRKGWDERSVNAVEFAERMEQAGADAVTVHGRTREQYYSGKADWDIIREVKAAVNIPVIANGDVFSFQDAESVLSYTQADALMIGRGAQGNPFIFREIAEYMKSGKKKEAVLPQQKIDTAIFHYQLALKYKEEYKAVREMRKHLGWYLKGLRSSAAMRHQLNTIEDAREVLESLNRYREQLVLGELS